MSDIEFRSDNPDIQNLAKLVLSLQVSVMQLSQRSEIDMLMISTLLDHVDGHEAMLDTWKSKVARYYPARAVSNLSDDRLQPTADELNRRIAIWSRAIEQHAQSED